jgi:protein-tyrosine phosphatase
MAEPRTSADSTPLVLFICTGNYYRSRHAEAVLNWRARGLGLPVRAFSRGLLTSLVADEPTPLSPHTASRLTALGIPMDLTAPGPRQLAEEDLRRAHLSVALRRGEHRALMLREHPAWADRIAYWDVEDIDEGPPAQALARIEDEVARLLARYA